VELSHKTADFGEGVELSHKTADFGEGVELSGVWN